ncbi:hypothetical protein BSIN_2840 [Burkholderia singularis]|uniref:Uncharacterized protein n=1 Tax=Burkholderia singularis TaxID=1503053 RepID=A0A238H2Z5_9BURK|nr:hypothetical protein BSIN_2840 [Burkholderia singularis]
MLECDGANGRYFCFISKISGSSNLSGQMPNGAAFGESGCFLPFPTNGEIRCI